MGYIRHHAIVVTGHRWSDDKRWADIDIEDAHRAATEIGLIVSPIIDGKMNSYASFFVAPDGSKEGWDDSDEYDGRRDRFIAWLRGASPEEAGWFSWAEVVLGDDDAEAHVERHAWDDVASGQEQR